MAGLTLSELADHAAALAQQRSLVDVEVYAKRGRSRLFALESRPDGDRVVPMASQLRDRYEAGWAVRYGDKRGWGFVSGSGQPPLDPPLVRPQAGRLLLPQTPGPDQPQLELPPLLSETMALRSIAALGAALPPVAIDRRLELQDGEAASQLANNHGLAVEWPHRTALVSLEEWLPGGAVLRLHTVTASAATAVELARRDWPEIVTMAQRLRWTAPVVSGPDSPSNPASGPESEGDAEVTPRTPQPAPGSQRASLILSAGAASSLVSAALSSWSNEGRNATVASPVVQLCDAPDWPQGPMSVPVDGQGQSLTRRSLVHAGTLVATPADAETAIVRRGWRDLPSPGYQQPLLLPGSASVEELAAGLEHGWWLPARIDVPAAISGPRPLVFLGRRILDGKVPAGEPPALLTLDLRPADFCRSVRELADDVTFHPVRDGVLGLPAVRVEGVRVLASGK